MEELLETPLDAWWENLLVVLWAWRLETRLVKPWVA